MMVRGETLTPVPLDWARSLRPRTRVVVFVASTRSQTTACGWVRTLVVIASAIAIQDPRIRPADRTS